MFEVSDRRCIAAHDRRSSAGAPHLCALPSPLDSAKRENSILLSERTRSLPGVKRKSVAASLGSSSDLVFPSAISNFGRIETSPEFNSFSTRFVTLSTAMRVKDLTRVQFLSVPCPTCGAGSAKCCLNSSGDERTEPHLGRKLFVVEIVGLKGIQSLRVRKRGNSINS
jgi:hypothetical protein